MIVTVGGVKGGSGKTTIASNIAVIRAKEKKVLLVDADDQGSISDWAENRESLGVVSTWTTVKITGTSLRSQILKMKGDYDDIIIDVGGRDTTSQRSALTVSDVFISPFQPRSFDIWTSSKLDHLVSEARAINPTLRSYAFINRGDSQGADNLDSINILKELREIQVVDKLVIRQRKAFSNASSMGLSVVELKPVNRKACHEIESLCKVLF